MSYYVTVDGVKMDKALVELAKTWEGYPDYVVIPLLVDSLKDAGKITGTERNTMDYICKTYYSKSAMFISVCQILELSVDV